MSQTLTRTKSSGSVNQKFSSPSPSIPLLKSKSSTFISPDQNESPMYNTRVTLRLRRSNSHLNACPTNGFSNDPNGADYQNGISNGNSRNQKQYYFGAHPSHSHQAPADIFSGDNQLPKPPLPPSCSKPILLRTVNIFLVLLVNGLITTHLLMSNPRQCISLTSRHLKSVICFVIFHSL